jgi:hypothetical protein
VLDSPAVHSVFVLGASDAADKLAREREQKLRAAIRLIVNSLEQYLAAK